MSRSYPQINSIAMREKPCGQPEDEGGQGEDAQAHDLPVTWEPPE